MKRTLLFVLALIAVGCVDAEQSETASDGSEQVTPSASCADLSFESGESPWLDYPLEDLRTCAEQGDVGAQFALGFMYATGDGVPEDDVEAVRWYRLAAEQGLARAQYILGVMYATGEGVPADLAEAARWYRLAADQGLARAQSDLGFMYDNGRGVPEDDVEAVRWYRLAAEQGIALAQYNLGLMYAYGEGVPENNVLAYMWMDLLAAQGDEGAQSDKEILEERMTRAQITEAQRLSREWLEAHPSGGNGLLSSEGPPPDGPFESYYENGQLRHKTTYKDGAAVDGLYESYHENGQLYIKGTYKDGEKCGEWLEEGETVTYDPCPPGLEDGN